MVGSVTRTADRAAEASLFSPRETELLAVTLQLLQQHGYDRLTLDAVAATARASKATVYRRWPTKAELVLAAFIEGIRQVAVAPDTGTLRGDLLQLGDTICQQARTARRHHPRGARRGVAQPRAERRNAAPVRRPAKSLDPPHLAAGRRPRRDRRRRHHRRTLGPAARLPHIPVHHPQPAAHPSHRAEPSSTTSSSPASPDLGPDAVAASKPARYCEVRSRTVLS